jgi:methionine synthase II (cobalamin-independent)
MGSWPGLDVREVLREVRGLLADDEYGLPHLPELPARGPGADMIGRAAGLLVEMPVDLQPAGWRLVDRAGRDAQRTATLWRRDLDELAEAFDGYEGAFKVQVAGPWTLAAALELTRGEKAVVDPGAARDLTASLAEGIRGHLDEVERLVPGAQVILQLDEPSLPAVLAGSLPTASGYGRIRAVDPQAAATGIRTVLEAAGTRATVVHCCHPGIPLPLLRKTGVTAIALDTTNLSPGRWESVAATVEEGIGVYAGCLPTDGTGTSRGAWQQLTEGWQRTGLALSGLDDIVVSPACGLASLTPEGARSVQEAALATARALTDEARSS